MRRFKDIVIHVMYQYYCTNLLRRDEWDSNVSISCSDL